MKIALVIDDSEFQRKYLVDILDKTKLFYKIIDAKDAEVGMRMVMKFDPDLIFMDYDMPRMDGLTASDMILKMKKDSKIVMVTAKDRDNLRKKALEIGIKDVIIKPYTGVEIAKAISSFLPSETSNNNEKQVTT